MEKDISTEEKIKEAARKVFHEKGYGQARTRDIAEEAGINLALLNYYFRSKEKLFDIIMEESLQKMFSLIENIINNKDTDLSQKIDTIVNRYIDSILANPNLPMFVISELQANAENLLKRIGVPKSIILQSYFYEQIQEQIATKEIKILTPMHVLINIISMSIFPIVAKQLVLTLHHPMTETIYTKFMNDRRILIPIWIKSMLQLDN